MAKHSISSSSTRVVGLSRSKAKVKTKKRMLDVPTEDTIARGVSGQSFSLYVLVMYKQRHSSVKSEIWIIFITFLHQSYLLQLELGCYAKSNVMGLEEHAKIKVM